MFGNFPGTDPKFIVHDARPPGTTAGDDDDDDDDDDSEIPLPLIDELESTLARAARAVSETEPGNYKPKKRSPNAATSLVREKQSGAKRHPGAGPPKPQVRKAFDFSKNMLAAVKRGMGSASAPKASASARMRGAREDPSAPFETTLFDDQYGNNWLKLKFLKDTTVKAK